ncbi:unnamed protein product [Trifolium pratense]|uniref:Uncharacterized protein n=1 Tax=Trifolium pratense TaxID=57577 RepID=A0ACB0KSS0_TRIPR|nr:unnamed protein product [Trifolium pratense]
MKFHKDYLDLILVPFGLLIMFSYHLFLLHRYINRPHTTVMGFENNDKRAWVDRIMQSQLIYGDTSATAISIKYICLLTCFLLAFSCFIQSARHFVHANYLISTPDSFVPVSSVELAVIMGGDFWSLGLRALYFALNLLLWFFGPIPMFICSLVMVLVLHYLDSNSRPLHLHPNRSQGDKFQMVKNNLNL